MLNARKCALTLSIAVAVGLSCTSAFASPAVNTEATDENAVKAVFTDFQESIKTGDTNKFLASVRNPNEPDQMARAESLTNNPDYTYTIDRIQKEDDHTYNITLSSSSDEGTYPSLSYEVEMENGAWKVENTGFYFVNKLEDHIDPKVLSASGMKKVSENTKFEVYQASPVTAPITPENVTENNGSTLAAASRSFGPYTLNGASRSAKIYCNGNVSINFFSYYYKDDTAEVTPWKYDQYGHSDPTYTTTLKASVESTLPSKLYGYYDFYVTNANIKQPAGTFTVTTY